MRSSVGRPSEVRNAAEVGRTENHPVLPGLASESRYRMEDSPTELPDWPEPLSATGHTIVVECG